MTQFISEEGWKSSRSIMEVLKEVDSDILALQDVKADEEKGMSPLSDLAASLGMKYVFAESWAPGYGNAILSKWPIKRWKVQKIANDEDFRYCFFRCYTKHADYFFLELGSSFFIKADVCDF
jgi:endonuclease/exonuclease/phosphatase family metal-dependent hydrolase